MTRMEYAIKSLMTTSGMHEKLVECDVSELIVPPYRGDFITLIATSPRQLDFASETRMKKMNEWSPDLPANLVLALKGISDATWWLANKDKDSSTIGWPVSWTNGGGNRAASENGQPNLFPASKLAESQKRVEESLPKSADPALVQFEMFAKKACQSPELAYLGMMALMYRQTKDPMIFEKFNEARSRIRGHLEAIDQIAGR